eukprot:1153941-Pelagomonas_calceolata.AAC.2
MDQPIHFPQQLIKGTRRMEQGKREINKGTRSTMLHPLRVGTLPFVTSILEHFQPQSQLEASFTRPQA